MKFAKYACSSVFALLVRENERDTNEHGFLDTNLRKFARSRYFASLPFIKRVEFPFISSLN